MDHNPHGKGSFWGDKGTVLLAAKAKRSLETLNPARIDPSNCELLHVITWRRLAQRAANACGTGSYVTDSVCHRA